MLRFHRQAYILLAASTVLAIGCSSEIPVYPVEGQVNFEGKPMAGGGSIALVPMTDQEGMMAGGEIAADGTYRLTTHSPGDGSMTGQFRVLITQVTEQEPTNTGDGAKVEKAAATVPPAERIPDTYADPLNSPLTMTVEAKDVNRIDFNLNRQGK